MKVITFVQLSYKNHLKQLCRRPYCFRKLSGCCCQGFCSSEKWLEDKSLSKGVRKFSHPSDKGAARAAPRPAARRGRARSPRRPRGAPARRSPARAARRRGAAGSVRAPRREGTHDRSCSTRGRPARPPRPPRAHPRPLPPRRPGARRRARRPTWPRARAAGRRRSSGATRGTSRTG